MHNVFLIPDYAQMGVGFGPCAYREMMAIHPKGSSVDVRQAPKDLPEGRSRTRYHQVLETLLGDINSGRFKPGDRIPTEAELAVSFSASRSTIARVMRDLKHRGLIHRKRRGGTHVMKREGRRIALFTPFAQSAAELGHIGGQIQAYLSDVASQHLDHIHLQLADRSKGDRLKQLMAATQALIQQQVTGVFYYPVELPQEIAHYNKLVVDKLVNAGVATVLVDRDIVSFPERSKLPLIAYDNRRGGYLLADHLIKRGCRRIAFISSPYASSAASDRLRGYTDALEDNGLLPDRSLIRPANLEDINVSFCESVMKELKPDAIICKMDHYAAVMGRHLVGLGFKVGKQVLLAGFDDQPFAELLQVPLTTIRFPAEIFAHTCYERLVANMASPSFPLRGMTLVDVELVVRESTGG